VEGTFAPELMEQTMARITLLLLCTGLVFFSSLPAPANAARASERRRLEAIVAALQACPDWTEVPKEDFARRKRITDIYIRLAHESAGSIRAGMALFLKRHPNPSVGYIRAEDKLFAFVRVVFIVPQRYVPQPFDPSSKFSFFGNPVYSDGADLLWPYSIDRTGQLVLSGVDTGMHTGPTPDGLSDFDLMASRFARRFRVTAQ
jgi:hypothetical protein